MRASQIKDSFTFVCNTNLNKSRKPENILWTNDFIPEYYDWNEFIDNKNVAIVICGGNIGTDTLNKIL